MQFSPDEIDFDDAKYFFDGVSGFMLRENKSKFTQKPRWTNDLDPAQAVIFLQDVDRYKNPILYLKTEQMIKIVANSLGVTSRKVVRSFPEQFWFPTVPFLHFQYRRPGLQS
jgi:hypothetical protein